LPIFAYKFLQQNYFPSRYRFSVCCVNFSLSLLLSFFSPRILTFTTNGVHVTHTHTLSLSPSISAFLPSLFYFLFPRNCECGWIPTPLSSFLLLTLRYQQIRAMEQEMVALSTSKVHSGTHQSCRDERSIGLIHMRGGGPASGKPSGKGSMRTPLLQEDYTTL
jgi:hypothetical protein